MQLRRSRRCRPIDREARRALRLRHRQLAVEVWNWRRSYATDRELFRGTKKCRRKKETGMTQGVDRQSHCTTLLLNWQTFFYVRFLGEFSGFLLIFEYVLGSEVAGLTASGGLN